jgi:hypothetical protein
MIVGPVDWHRNVVLRVGARLAAWGDHHLVLLVPNDSHRLVCEPLHNVVRKSVVPLIGPKDLAVCGLVLADPVMVGRLLNDQ